MKCPKCGKDMEEGFLYAPMDHFYPSGIFWDYSQGGTKDDLIPLVKAQRCWKDYVSPKALRCKECKLVQFEYDL
jgi:hypothetical protein